MRHGGARKGRHRSWHLRRDAAPRRTHRWRAVAATGNDRDAGRREGLDQGRHRDRRLRLDQGLRRLQPRRPAEDRADVRRLHQQERRGRRPQDHPRLQGVPPDSRAEARPAVAVHRLGRRRQGLCRPRRLHRLHRPGAAVPHQRAPRHPHRPRARPALDRRLPRRTPPHVGRHQGARRGGPRHAPERDRQAQGQEGRGARQQER